MLCPCADQESIKNDQFRGHTLSRTLYATRTSLSIGFIGVIVAFVLGLTFGGISGYLITLESKWHLV